MDTINWLVCRRVHVQCMFCELCGCGCCKSTGQSKLDILVLCVDQNTEARRQSDNGES